MSRKVSIGWFRQRSGRYALKGITIQEGDQAYDSMNTFREEDARWLTKVLGAEADVELAGSKGEGRTTEGFPEWAITNGQAAVNDEAHPLEWERASATLLREQLAHMVHAIDSHNVGNGFRRLSDEANAVLLATDAGTHYTPAEARTILERREQNPKRTKGKL
jgi:hypothetical protein